MPVSSIDGARRDPAEHLDQRSQADDALVPAQRRRVDRAGADTGVGRAVLASLLAAIQSEALAAVTEILANYSSADGVHLDASIWITTGNASRL